jgi:flagellar biosynthesis protein FlhB
MVMSDSSGEERTVAPTERRIERLRRAGQVAYSRELVSGFVIAAACLVLAVGAKAGSGCVLAYLHAALASVGRATPGEAMRIGLDTLVTVLGLPLGLVWLVALFGGLAQTRGNLGGANGRAAGSRLVPRLSHILGRAGATALVLDLCKLALLSALVGWAILPCLAAAMGLCGAPVTQILAACGVLARHMGVTLALAVLGLGAADYLLERRRYRARLRTTPEEAKREQRESEGDPEHKAERRRLHREWQMESSELRTAELLLVEPGEVALAVAYSGVGDEAPVVIGRGERLLAGRLEALARHEGVPVFVAPALVRALSAVEVGGEIPEATYLEVAELMVRARKRRREGTAGAEADGDETPSPGGPRP